MSLAPCEPQPTARTGKSAHAILMRAAEFFAEHGQPPADVSEFRTLADLLLRPTPGHFRAYAKLCEDRNARAAALESGRAVV